MKITESMVRQIAAKIHKCPGGYCGPCWGATDADKVVARMVIEMVTGKEAIRAALRPARRDTKP